MAALAQLTAQSSLDVELQRARERATITGDLPAAIAEYQRIYERAGADRVVSSKALIAQAETYEKLNDARAQELFKQVVDKFSDQPAAALARPRLAAMGPAVSKAQAGASSTRRIQVPNIVLTDINRDGTIAAGHEQNGTANQSLVLLNLASSTVTRLNVEGTGPVLSLDGRQLAYSGAYSGGPLAPPLQIVGTAAGSTPRTLVQTSRPVRGLQPIGWSADGTSIFALGGTDGGLGLVSVRVSDGTITTLKTLEGIGGNPIVVRVSPDRRFVAYVRNGTVYIAGIEGQNQTAVGQIAGVNQLQAWSADGSRIFFTNTRSTPSTTWDLWSVPVADGAVSGPPSLLQKSFQGSLLGASTTGTSYSFRRVFGDAAERMTANLLVADRSAGSRIVDMFPGASAAVSPDGERVAFLRIDGNGGGYYDPIVRVLATGTERLCKLNSVGPNIVRWLHDGSGFLIHLSRLPSGADGPGSFYFINATSCESTLVLQDLADRTRGNMVALSLDNKTLYATKRQTPCPRGTAPCSGPWTGIVGVNLATGLESPVATFPGNGFPNEPSLTLSPDGSTLALRFFASEADSRNQQARIATVRADGSGYREIVGPFLVNNGPSDNVRWTPDGQSLLFAMAKAGQTGWRIMRVSAGGGQPVFDGLDSASLVGDIAVPTLNPSGPFNMDVLPDGRMIVSARTEAVNELWAIDNIAR